MYWITNELCHQLLTPDSDSLFINLPKHVRSQESWLVSSLSYSCSESTKWVAAAAGAAAPSATTATRGSATSACASASAAASGRAPAPASGQPSQDSEQVTPVLRIFRALFMCCPQILEHQNWFSDCCSADFGPHLSSNQMYNKQKVNFGAPKSWSVYVPRARTARGSTRRCFDSVHPMSLT